MTPTPTPTPAADLTERLAGGNGVFLASAGSGPDLAEAGWVESEVVAVGVAVSYTGPATDPPDGRLSLSEGPTASYRTRVVVRRPADPAAFSGTVVVEWLNVSGGLDANPDWSFLAAELNRRGIAWVGVSAQRVGVEGGHVAVAPEGGETFAGTGLKGLDPDRYGALDHPGDAFAYDVYTQVGAALREGAPSLLGELTIERIVAIGESQAAFALTTYVNGVHLLDPVYDGYLLHSRGRGGLPLGTPGEAVVARDSMNSAPLPIRTDLDVPVLILETETDLYPVLGYAQARQDDTDRIRLWEVAGTAHADASVLGPYASMVDCGVPINRGPQRFAVRAALRALDRWVRTGEAPPIADRIEAEVRARDVTIRRDADGNALGGIRFPQVEVPVATLSGEPGPVDTLMCQLVGQTHALAAERLGERYPSAEAYLAAYEAATDAVIAAGFAIPEDRDEILADARPDLIPT
jgi:hypothetical protein